ncbi:MAG: NAD(P)H-dependent oxidoreductase subunit E [Gammaproteobacteria bacterium]|nr:NAD(P)H-dependent oxidoreductase subunit E [Gammaproteobacteria bacterium]
MTTTDTFPRCGPYPAAAPFAPIREELTTRFGAMPDRLDLLQILVSIQHRLGYVPAEAISWLATNLGLSRAEIHGVVAFYSFLEETPPAPYTLRFSTNITELWQGQEANMARFKDLPNVRALPTSCIGLGDQGPAALVNGYPLPRLTATRLDAIARAIASRRPVAEWPAEWFKVDPNVRLAGPLLEFAFTPGALVERVLAAGDAAFMEMLRASGLRGRGGAGFATHAKWDACRAEVVPEKYVVCNADEGEPGTFKDRLLLSDHAELLIEGMTIAARVVGAKQGYIYLRGEYLWLYDRLNAALEARRRAGLLGAKVCGAADFPFDIAIHLGAGAYVCGEESALLESLEGRRGVPRIRPPFPATHGYRGRPTVVNNVETYCAIAQLAGIGAAEFAALGSQGSAGTKLHSVSGDCAHPGIFECAMGTQVSTLLDLCGTRDPLAVQVGGPSGRLLFPEEFHLPLDFSHVSSGGSFMVIGRERDLFELVYNFVAFFHHESCGFCTPCRSGSNIMLNALQRIRRGQGTEHELQIITEAAAVASKASHCGLGHTLGNPFQDLERGRPAVFQDRLRDSPDGTVLDLKRAVAEARALRER